MQVYQNLKIEGQDASINAFLSELDMNSCGWKSNTEILKQGGLGADYKAFDVPVALLSHSSRSARLFLHINPSRTACSLANIVPNGGQLTPDEYNKIVRAFYDECVWNNASAKGLNVQLSESEVSLADTLSSQNIDLLEKFTRGANPETGSTHPMNRSRWLTFISASALDNQILDAELLRGFLKEKGFSGDIASELTTEYQFGIDLIRQVNTIRHEQDSIHASS